MGLFGGRSRDIPPADGTKRAATTAPWSLWADGLGKLAIRAVQIIVVVALAGGIIWGLQSLTLVTIPLVLALIFASALSPVVGGMRRRGIPSIVATLVTLLGIVAVLGGVGWLVAWAVRDQWDDLSSQAQQGFATFADWAQHLPFFPEQEELDSLIDQAVGWLTSSLGQFGSGAIAVGGAVANFVAGFVLFVVILFFFLKDGPQLWEFLLRPFRGDNYDRAKRVGDKTVGVFGSYLRGTASVAFVDAVGILIGLLILQVPLAIPLAVLVFLLAFIPIVGATLAGVLAALVALVANDWINALLVVGVVILVNQLEGNFLQPVLMGRSMKLHAFVILIALTVGTAVGGILGAVLAVPITAAVWGAIQVWEGPDAPARWARRRPAEQPL